MIKNLIRSSANKLTSFFSNTTYHLKSKIIGLFKSNDGSLEDLQEEIEELLLASDLGASLANKIATKCTELLIDQGAEAEDQLESLLKNELSQLIQDQTPTILPQTASPQVILFVGVNGSGKTTSLAKIAQLLKNEGKSVLVGAADTFRTAAVEQLETWANRVGCDIVKGKLNADPSSVVFDTIQAGLARGADYILLDSAGRLDSKSHLMKELNKIERTCKKLIPEAPHQTLLVIDASIGQNAIEQASAFSNFVNISGIVLSKYDGTPRAGSCISIYQKLKLPIYYTTTGEQIGDIEHFNPELYIESLIS